MRSHRSSARSSLHTSFVWTDLLPFGLFSPPHTSNPGSVLSQLARGPLSKSPANPKKSPRTHETALSSDDSAQLRAGKDVSDGVPVVVCVLFGGGRCHDDDVSLLCARKKSDRHTRFSLWCFAKRKQKGFAPPLCESSCVDMMRGRIMCEVGRRGGEEL